MRYCPPESSHCCRHARSNVCLLRSVGNKRAAPTLRCTADARSHPSCHPCSRKRCSAIQWNPEVATQLMVASDDDMSPALQLWDLRNSVSPVR